MLMKWLHEMDHRSLFLMTLRHCQHLRARRLQGLMARLCSVAF